MCSTWIRNQESIICIQGTGHPQEPWLLILPISRTKLHSQWGSNACSLCSAYFFHHHYVPKPSFLSSQPTGSVLALPSPMASTPILLLRIHRLWLKCQLQWLWWAAEYIHLHELNSYACSVEPIGRNHVLLSENLKLLIPIIL